MKQQNLIAERDYVSHPRSYAERRDPFYNGDIHNPYPEQRAKQSEKESCDINEIMKRFEATGLLPEQHRTPQYGDFSTMETYHEAMGIVAEANSQFASLPAAVRDQFHNDPAQFLAFVEESEKDASKREWLVEHKLAEKVELPKKDPNLAALEKIAENTTREGSPVPKKKADKAD